MRLVLKDPPRFSAKAIPTVTRLVRLTLSNFNTFFNVLAFLWQTLVNTKAVFTFALIADVLIALVIGAVNISITLKLTSVP